MGEAFQRASFFLEKGRQLVEASESEGKTGEVEEGERPQKRGEGGGKTEREETRQESDKREEKERGQEERQQIACARRVPVLGDEPKFQRSCSKSSAIRAQRNDQLESGKGKEGAC